VLFQDLSPNHVTLDDFSIVSGEVQDFSISAPGGRGRLPGVFNPRNGPTKVTECQVAITAEQGQLGGSGIGEHLHNGSPLKHHDFLDSLGILSFC